MVKLLEIAKYFLQKAEIPKDGILADFTMGNGHDTYFLSSLVPDGKVYSFDIQPEALENTRGLLGNTSNVQLILDSHANLDKYIKEKIHGGMFNLGYRPGGNKSLHTMSESSLTATLKALEVLLPGGVIVISVYPGHEEGKKEGELLLEKLQNYNKCDYNIATYKIINADGSPYIIIIQKNKRNNG